ncbi:hypothetical protein CRYO30217_03517 [Parvicella tangerina]|uniref:Uncharacterized protein n=2 Tax=Parvicella tangerina TaxID=2829795 RepID=A0A916JRG4_9FLAO|nr:hypothetical protein CRYO30217_03517 [Parvicella tangerina]
MMCNVNGEVISFEGREETNRNNGNHRQNLFYCYKTYSTSVISYGIDTVEYNWFSVMEDTNSNVFRVRYTVYENELLFTDSLADKQYKYFNDFRNKFFVGEYDFSIQSKEIEGISIESYFNGVFWSSREFDPNHSLFYNSYFEVTDFERFYSYEAKKDGLRVFANFNATLYNGQGDSIRIENADCAMLFVP